MRVNNTVKTILKVALVICFYYGLYLLSKDHFETLTDMCAKGISFSWIPLLFAFLLVLPNWFLESLKWRMALVPVEDVSIRTSVMGVFRGIPPSLFTPNRVGEAFGRPSVLQRGNRISGALATAYCGFSQMPVMMLMGILGCLYFSLSGVAVPSGSFITSWWFISAGLLGCVLLLLVFLFPKYTIPFVKSSGKAEGFRRKLYFFCQYQYRDKFCMIALSLARYLVYSIQSYLTMLSVGLQMDLAEGLSSVFIIYMLMSFVPRPALAELGVRCSASVLVLGSFTCDYTLPTLQSIMLWTINLLIPALVGAFLYVLKKR